VTDTVPGRWYYRDGRAKPGHGRGQQRVPGAHRVLQTVLHTSSTSVMHQQGAELHGLGTPTHATHKIITT
jgi:hypothetical protein